MSTNIVCRQFLSEVSDIEPESKYSDLSEGLFSDRERQSELT